MRTSRCHENPTDLFDPGYRSKKREETSVKRNEGIGGCELDSLSLSSSSGRLTILGVEVVLLLRCSVAAAGTGCSGRTWLKRGGRERVEVGRENEPKERSSKLEVRTVPATIESERHFLVYISVSAESLQIGERSETLRKHFSGFLLRRRPENVNASSSTFEAHLPTTIISSSLPSSLSLSSPTSPPASPRHPFPLPKSTSAPRTLFRSSIDPLLAMSSSPSTYDYDSVNNPLGLKEYERTTPRYHSTCPGVRHFTVSPGPDNKYGDRSRELCVGYSTRCCQLVFLHVEGRKTEFPVSSYSRIHRRRRGGVVEKRVSGGEGQRAREGAKKGERAERSSPPSLPSFFLDRSMSISALPT